MTYLSAIFIQLLYKLCEEHAVELATIIANCRLKLQLFRSPWGVHESNKKQHSSISLAYLKLHIQMALFMVLYGLYWELGKLRRVSGAPPSSLQAITLI